MEHLGLEKGDLIQVDWVDIAEDPVGDPNKAQLARSTSYGLFWDKRMDRDGMGVESLITTTTIDKGGSEQSGYCIYPFACVTNITLIKRRKRGKGKKELNKGNGTANDCAPA